MCVYVGRERRDSIRLFLSIIDIGSLIMGLDLMSHVNNWEFDLFGWNHSFSTTIRKSSLFFLELMSSKN